LEQPPTIQIDDAGHGVIASQRALFSTQRKRFDAAYFGFFPRQVPVRAGGIAFFKVSSRGEPHSVAMGSLIDAATAKIDALGSDASLEQIEALPEMQRVPSVLPMQSRADGVAALNGSAADPCYLDSTDPPTSATGGTPRCARRSRPAFNGRQRFFNVGVLDTGGAFKLKLASNIAPGTYSFMCLVHRSTMRGALRVLAPGERAPRPGKISRTGKSQSDRTAAELAEPAKRAWRAQPSTAVAGVGAPGIAGVVTSFGPTPYRVPVGGSMSWTLLGMHSISFDPSTAAKQGIFVRRAGSLQLNEAAWLPVNSPSIPAEVSAYPPTAAHDPVVIDGGAWDGSASLHTGIIRSLAPGAIVYRLSFTRPGSYAYSCVVHPLMAGKVQVG
jgi:plastocyanin